MDGASILQPLRPLLGAAVLGLLWVAETSAPMFPGRVGRGRHLARHLVLGAINGAMAAALAFSVAAVSVWASRHSLGVLHWLALPPALDMTAGLLLFDLWQYWWHRFNHELALLWRFHAIHHSDEDLDASSGFRFHPGEMLLSLGARLLVVPGLGLEVAHLVVYEFLTLPVILFHHGNWRIPAGLDSWLRVVLVTPRMHWVHHSRRRVETDSNYSSFLSVWDRCFGTFKLRNDPEKIELGLEASPGRREASFLDLLARPFMPRDQ